jgi:hypothetical protein
MYTRNKLVICSYSTFFLCPIEDASRAAQTRVPFPFTLWRNCMHIPTGVESNINTNWRIQKHKYKSLFDENEYVSMIVVIIIIIIIISVKVKIKIKVVYS